MRPEPGERVMIGEPQEAWRQAHAALGFPPEWIVIAVAAIGMLLAWRRRAAGKDADGRWAPRPLPHAAPQTVPSRTPVRAGLTTSNDEAAAASSGRQREDLAFLKPPPRKLSVAAFIRVLFGGAQQFGWFWLGITSIFGWVFAGQAEVAWALRAGALGETEAMVTESFETGASEGDVKVYGSRYVFELAGQPVEGVSYATGHHLAAGEVARVEYALSDPRRSRIVGMRSAQFGPAVLLVLIFPGVGLLIIFFSLRARPRELRLLRNGVLAFGRLVEKIETNTTVNKRRVYELRFEFDAPDGSTQAVSMHTHLPENVEDDAREPLLHDPQDYGRAALLDDIPGKPRIERDGSLSASWGKALSVLVLPALTLGANAWWIARTWSG